MAGSYFTPTNLNPQDFTKDVNGALYQFYRQAGNNSNGDYSELEKMKLELAKKQWEDQMKLQEKSMAFEQKKYDDSQKRTMRAGQTFEDYQRALAGNVFGRGNPASPASIGRDGMHISEAAAILGAEIPYAKGNPPMGGGVVGGSGNPETQQRMDEAQTSLAEEQARIAQANRQNYSSPQQLQDTQNFSNLDLQNAKTQGEIALQNGDNYIKSKALNQEQQMADKANEAKIAEIKQRSDEALAKRNLQLSQDQNNQRNDLLKQQVELTQLVANLKKSFESDYQKMPEYNNAVERLKQINELLNQLHRNAIKLK